LWLVENSVAIDDGGLKGTVVWSPAESSVGYEAFMLKMDENDEKRRASKIIQNLARFIKNREDRTLRNQETCRVLNFTR